MFSYYDPIVGQVLVKEPVFVEKDDLSQADLSIGLRNPQLYPRKKFKKIQGLTQKGNPYHDPNTGEFASKDMAPTSLAIGGWVSSSVGTRVRVDDPSNKYHGKVGVVNSQQGNSHSIAFDEGGSTWVNSGQIKALPVTLKPFDVSSILKPLDRTHDLKVKYRR